MPDGGVTPTTWGAIFAALAGAIGILWRAFAALNTNANARLDLAHQNEIKQMKEQFELVLKQYDARIRVAESYAEKFMNIAFKVTGLAEDNLRLAKQKLTGDQG